jgi:hypothetical protein
MNKKEQENDWLKPLFSRLPNEDLPDSFKEELMKRIGAEADRIRKRNELIGLLIVSLASLAIAGLAAGALLYAGVRCVRWDMPELVALPFYLYIGALTLLLLGGDHLLRRTYRKKHPD